LNIFINQYLLALGEFETLDNFDTDNGESPALWLTFIFATFALQLIFLNMLIGIMAMT